MGRGAWVFVLLFLAAGELVGLRSLGLFFGLFGFLYEASPDQTKVWGSGSRVLQEDGHWAPELRACPLTEGRKLVRDCAVEVRELLSLP